MGQSKLKRRGIEMKEDLELKLLHTDITETRIEIGSYLDNR